MPFSLTTVSPKMLRGHKGLLLQVFAKLFQELKTEWGERKGQKGPRDTWNAKDVSQQKFQNSILIPHSIWHEF